MKRTGLSIGVLVTNFNTWEITRRCVDACFTHDRGNFEQILVYDDGSTILSDGEFPDGTEVFMASQNLGLTKALNVAFGLMRTDVIVLFDSDAFPVTPFCEKVREAFASNPVLGLLGMATVDEDGHRTESASPEPNHWSWLLGQAAYAKFEHFLSDKSGNLSVFTCAMAVRKDVFEELKGFDEQFDWLDLDQDFSMRINRSSWSIEMLTAVKVFHKGGGTPQRTAKRLLRFYKNRWYLLRKFDRIPQPRLIRALILVRLRCEYLCLRIMGSRLFPDPEILNDKLESRKALLEYCAENY